MGIWWGKPCGDLMGAELAWTWGGSRPSCGDPKTQEAGNLGEGRAGSALGIPWPPHPRSPLLCLMTRENRGWGSLGKIVSTCLHCYPMQ